jgi:ABC-type branched-subunit amino acid transport system substrate-binding protein
MRAHRVLAAALLAAGLVPAAAAADNTIKIGFPMPLSGPASVYGVPVTNGAET